MPYIFDTMFESLSSYDYDGVDYLDEMVSESNTYYGEIETIEGVEEAVSDFVGDMYRLEAALYVTDYALEKAVATESAVDVDAVLEKSTESVFTKIKNKIAELWQKFTSFIRNIVTNFKAFGIASEEFIKKNGDAIIENFKKNGSKYKYNGYTYDPVISGKAESTWTSEFAKIKESAKSNLDITAEELYNSLGRAIGGNDTRSAGEVVTVFSNQLRGESVTEHAPSDADVKAWVAACRDHKKTLKTINGTNAETKKQMNGHIAEVKKKESEAKKPEAAQEAHRQLQKITALASLTTRIGAANVNIHIEAYKAFTRRLREIKSLKSEEKVAESYYSYDYDESNLFEAAFNAL